MATNYSEPLNKGDVAASLINSTLPTYIVTKILQSLDAKVFVNEVNSDFKTNDLRGNDLVLINQAGTMDLSLISKADIKDLDALVFTTNENVNFTLSGNNTLSFKGVVSTNGGDDIINLNSIRGVTVSSGYGNDSVNTGAGNDTVLAGAGNDSINTGDGNDIVFAGEGNNRIITGRGNDYVSAGAGNDSINTGDGNDTVSAGAGNDSINTGAGNDYVSAGAGNDIINTGDGNDYVSAGAGNDSINTGTGNDTVSAGAGNDIIITGDGNDSVSTGLGNDSVTTGNGNDSVYVGAGNDSVNTGAGTDIVKLAAGFSGNGQFDGGAGTSDAIDLRQVVITDVDKNGAVLTITLDDTSVITATNFETFIYDSSTDDVEGGMVIVGVNQFVAHNFSI